MLKCMIFIKTIVLLSIFGALASASCPFLYIKDQSRTAADFSSGILNYNAIKNDPKSELSQLNLNEVMNSIAKLLTNSQEFWPADFDNYGPFFVRLAWHCAGSYRKSDGRGGCDGGRQRFDPERSWADNTNLDKARRLLWPIKQQYGSALSWGDLFILAGTTAIKSMGGPVLGFCAGRIDDSNGLWSEELGPTEIQEKVMPCEINGQCKSPLGATTIGLIYVNPEGPMGQPIPSESAGEIRDTFDRMGMNDSETVALIGGGHAFGKAHGACPLGPGPSPMEDPANPWPGNCGTGKGADTFTSGFEGSWTSTPTRWSNEYFKNLISSDWEVYMGPGGHNQWRQVNSNSTIMMLTSDISLTKDPAGSYQKYVDLFANDVESFNDAFAHAWYKLTTRDMGPVSRCLGSLVPPAQPFQYPLPPAPSQSDWPNFEKVRVAVLKVMTTANPSVLEPDYYLGQPYYGAVFVELAYLSASTFRVTDYLGGPNGARIRFSPQKDWPTSVAMSSALEILRPVKDAFGDSLTWADLIVFAAQVALEDAGALKMPFCPGRSDALDGSGSDYLSPNLQGSSNINQVQERVKISGLTTREFIALAGRLRSPMQQRRLGYSGSYTANPTAFSNSYFIELLSESWSQYNISSSGLTEYKASSDNTTTKYMVPMDLVNLYQAEFQAVAQSYASDSTLFSIEFAAAWTKLMNIDRFDGPVGNVCEFFDPHRTY